MNIAQKLSLFERAQIAWSRIVKKLGWSGVLGLALIVLSGGLTVWNFQQNAHVRSLPRTTMQPARASAAPDQLTEALSLPPAELPRGAQHAELLQRIQQHVASSGLTWSKAEYSLSPITQESLADLKIKTTLIGSYPKLRQLITGLLIAEPALALRSLSLKRNNVDTGELEAHLDWSFFLADSWPATTPESPAQ